LTYEKSGTSLKQEFKHAEFCSIDEADDRLDDADYTITACNYKKSGNATGWADNFNAARFSFDVDSLAGNYAYIWQAGKQDPRSRRFSFKVDVEGSATTANAYYGYGPSVYTEDSECAEFSDYLIDGMVCNWTGPGGFLSKTPEERDAIVQPYVQRQTLELVSDVWTVTDEQIKYPPTNACTCTGACGFTYLTPDEDFSNDSDQVGTPIFDLDDFADYEADFSAPGAPSF